MCVKSSIMTDMPDTAKKMAPYVAFASFKTFLSNLREGGGAPIVIDNSVFGNISGTLRSQLKGALKFFGFIDEGNKPTAGLHKAVAATASDAEWKALVKDLLAEHYAPILAHPLASTTPSQLQKEFQDNYGGSVDVIEKAITFFIYAAKEAAVPLTSRLTERQKPQRRGGGAQRRREPVPGAGPEPPKREEEPKAKSDASETLMEIKDVTAEAMTRILKMKPPKKVQQAVLTIILYLTMGDDAFEGDAS